MPDLPASEEVPREFRSPDPDLTRLSIYRPSPGPVLSHTWSRLILTSFPGDGWGIIASLWRRGGWGQKGHDHWPQDFSELGSGAKPSNANLLQYRPVFLRWNVPSVQCFSIIVDDSFNFFFLKNTSAVLLNCSKNTKALTSPLHGRPAPPRPKDCKIRKMATSLKWGWGTSACY